MRVFILKLTVTGGEGGGRVIIERIARKVHKSFGTGLQDQ